jgi:hypothetical protein
MEDRILPGPRWKKIVGLSGAQVSPFLLNNTTQGDGAERYRTTILF